MSRYEVDAETGAVTEHPNAEGASVPPITLMLSELAVLDDQYRSGLDLLRQAWVSADIQAADATEAEQMKSDLKAEWDETAAQYQQDRAAILAKYLNH